MGNEGGNNHDTALIIEQIKMVNQTMNAHFQTIRDDIRRMEDDHRKEIVALEGRSNEKIKAVSEDVETIESNVEELNKKAAVGGTVLKVGGAGLAVVFGEFIKRMFFNGS